MMSLYSVFIMIITDDRMAIPAGWIYLLFVIVPILILIYVIRIISSSTTKREDVKSCNYCGANVSPDDEYCNKCQKRLTGRGRSFGLLFRGGTKPD